MKLNAFQVVLVLALALATGCNYSIDKVSRESRNGQKPSAPTNDNSGETSQPGKGDGETAPTFSQVHPILIAQCLGCHSNSKRVASLSVETWQTLTENPRAVVPGDPENSGIYASVTDDYMPDASWVSRGLVRPLTATEKETLRLWILAGAKND